MFHMARDIAIRMVIRCVLVETVLKSIFDVAMVIISSTYFPLVYSVRAISQTAIKSILDSFQSIVYILPTATPQLKMNNPYGIKPYLNLPSQLELENNG